MGVSAIRALGSAGLTVLLFAQTAGAVSIYGDDDRRDPYAVSDARLRQIASATAVHVLPDRLKLDPASGNYRWAGITLAAQARSQGFALCPGEKFGNQLLVGFCSATLVAPDVVLTAGHCLEEKQACETARYVFGFEARAANDSADRPIPAADVYGCREILAYSYDGTGVESEVPDFALVRLDRPVSGRAPVAIDRETRLSSGDAISLVSYPFGLPVKIGAGKVTGEIPGRFRSDLDAFSGSSGGAVVSAATGKIVGILTSGKAGGYYFNGKDPDDPCLGAKHFPSDDPGGEYSVPASALPTID